MTIIKMYQPKRRSEEIDFVKCVMILLMIVFHLVYIGDTYSSAKAFVYAFHMPAFLIISGYLLNMQKSVVEVSKSMMWIALPYAIMESGYIAGAALLPIREHIDDLTILGFLDRLLLNPIGPYWYLHTLIICTMTTRLVFACEMGQKHGLVPTLMLSGMFLWCMSNHGYLAMSSALYFLIGVALRNGGALFSKVFQGSWYAVVIFVAFALMTDSPDRFTLVGLGIVFSAMCTCSKLHELTEQYLPRVNSLCLFIGRNTLLLLLFSPLFTILAKTYQPYLLAFEPTGMLFMIISLVLAVAGSLAIGWAMDRLHLSPYFFGRMAINN